MKILLLSMDIFHQMHYLLSTSYRAKCDRVHMYTCSFSSSISTFIAPNVCGSVGLSHSISLRQSADSLRSLVE